MTFDDILAQVVVLLQRQGRVSYRALKRRFNLDDDYLEDLKAELIIAQQVAVDEAGKVLVWTGGASAISAPSPEAPQPGQRPDTQEESSTQVASPPAKLGAPDAERRQLTVLFCDLVDSTALAGRLDPEDWREVVRAYQATCAEVIQRFEGHIAQYLGDGLLVYFGYPQAHEDDAQRAVRAGLGMVEVIEQLNTRLQEDTRASLAIRVGIHTGLVVVGVMGGGGRQEQLALGETPNLAARLQGLAEADTVVISGTTYRMVRGFFACRDLGSHTLKGILAPVPVYRVLNESGVQTRLDVAGLAGLTPLVGREQEVELLLDRWAQVKEGRGQVVLLSGEAGIGKSRLVQALKVHLADAPHARLEGRGSPYHQQSPLFPVIAHLHRLLRWRSDDGPREKLQKLEAALAQYGLSRPDLVPLFGSLLALPLPERYPPLSLRPERQRQKTLEALLEWLLEEAKQQPVLYILEDLHWVDPSTLELLSLTIDQAPMARLLILLTCRPEFCPPWGVRAHLTTLTLRRLPRQEVEVMIDWLTAGRALPAEVRQQVVAKTDGVPLFVEELTKMVLESRWLQEQEDHHELTGALPPLAIPDTLHDSLMERLDRLAAVKSLAQLGATLGREFSYELLQAVSPWDEGTLQQGLHQLVAAEFLYQQGLPPQATYRFKHALIQDAAYQSLLKRTRQQYHRCIAQVLAEQFPGTAESQPELLAHHYTEAGLGKQAIIHWQRAGQRALERSAHAEAVGHCTRGLEVLKTLLDTPEHTQHELTLQHTLGISLMATKGYAAPEVERAYGRARELCQRVGESSRLYRVLGGLGAFYLLRGKYHVARELAEQCLAQAQRQQDLSVLLRAHMGLGQSLSWLGELVAARAHLDQAIALCASRQQRSSGRHGGADPEVSCQGFAAVTLWLLGYPVQALQRSRQAYTLAQDLAHPFSIVQSLHSALFLHQFSREVQAVRARAEEMLMLATEQGFGYYVAVGTMMRGWALAKQGHGEGGITQLHQGLAAYRATGAEMLLPWKHALLAEAYGQRGQAAEGLHVLAEALAMTEKSGERIHEAELYLLKGKLLSALSVEDQTEVEACFRHALEIARHQQAKSWELRAAVSLSRLWRQQGKRAEARELLAPIYGWFTEGFDTADLQDAKALLAQL